MIKFLIITFIICYILFKVGGYLFKVLFWSLGNKQRQTFNNGHNRRSYQSKREGDINIEYIPKNKNGQAPKTKEFKGGEYVEYEDVK